MIAAIAFATSSIAAGPAPRAAARPAPPEGAVKAAPGIQVDYSERGGTNVLYLEEKGGMVSVLAPTPPDPRQLATETARSAPPEGRPATVARASLPSRP